MPSDSLHDMARRACARYIRGITDIGSCPYSLIRPVLLKIESPSQLYQIEQNSPQIIGEDAEIWLALIKRDVPNYLDRPHQPSNPKNWYKVYKKLKKDNEMEFSASEDRLAAIMKARTEERTANTAVVGQPLLKERVRTRSKIAYDYNSGRTGSKGSHKMSFMDKIRKEAVDRSHAKRNRPLAATTSRSGFGAVKKAPAMFVEDVRKKEEIKAAMASRPKHEVPRAVNTSPVVKPRPPIKQAYDVMADREARLKALKAGKPGGVSASSLQAPPGSNTTTVDFDDSNDDDDDLFSDVTPARPVVGIAASAAQSSRQLKRKPQTSVFMSDRTPKKRHMVVD